MSLYAASIKAMSIQASVANPYHPPKHSDAPIDVLLAVIGSIILLLVMVVPPAVARSRDDRRRAAETPAVAEPSEP